MASAPPLTEREQAKVELLTAQGAGSNAIGQVLDRHHITVERHLAKPETQQRVADDKAALAATYREKARDCMLAIDDEKIQKATALQLATASGILLDKSLLLAGDMPPIRVEVLIEAVQAIRQTRR